MQRNLVIAVAAAGAVVCGGTVLGLALSNDGKDTTSTPVSAVEEVHVSGGASKDGTSGGHDDTAAATGTVPELALATALAEQPGIVTEIELQDDDARTWQIEILGTDDTWYDVEVSLDGTQVLGSHTSEDDDGDDGDDGDDDNDDNDAFRLLNSKAIQAAEAVRLAQEATAAGLREASVDDDGHWELELRDEDGKEYELTIDLASGQITTENDDGGDDSGARDDNNDDRGDDNSGDDNDDRGDDNDDRGGNNDDRGGNNDGDDDNNDDRGDG